MRKLVLFIKRLTLSGIFVGHTDGDIGVQSRSVQVLCSIFIPAVLYRNEKTKKWACVGGTGLGMTEILNSSKCLYLYRIDFYVFCLSPN